MICLGSFNMLVGAAFLIVLFLLKSYDKNNVIKWGETIGYSPFRVFC